jgi:hypothetical protein
MVRSQRELLMIESVAAVEVEPCDSKLYVEELRMVVTMMAREIRILRSFVQIAHDPTHIDICACTPCSRRRKLLRDGRKLGEE